MGTEVLTHLYPLFCLLLLSLPLSFPSLNSAKPLTFHPHGANGGAPDQVAIMVASRYAHYLAKVTDMA